MRRGEGKGKQKGESFTTHPSAKHTTPVYTYSIRYTHKAQKNGMQARDKRNRDVRSFETTPAPSCLRVSYI
jgi:hypothetical protein